MFKKFMLCVFLCLPFSIQFTYSMEIEQESIQEEQELLKQSAEQVPFKWHEMYVKKSFIFKTPDNKIFILVKGSFAHKFYALPENDIKPKEIASSINDHWPDIEHYVPVIYKIKDDYYFYAAIKEKATLLKKEKYSVVKITIVCNSTNNPKPKIDPLYDHNSPIMHLGIITKGSKKYLVSGSFYPSIKIYDFEKEKVIKRLHNRFLLGTSDETLIYAKKIDPRPYFGLGRKLAYDLDKEYNCEICTLLPFNGNDEIKWSKQENITITYAKYPSLIYAEGNLVFDRKKNAIISWETSNKQLERIFNLSQFGIQIERGQKIAIDDVNKKKLIELLTDKNFELCFKESMTYKSFTDFHFKNPTKKVDDYIKDIITNIIQNIIDSTSKEYELIKNKIIYNYFEKVNKNQSLKVVNMSFDQESWLALKNATDKAFDITYKLISIDDTLINSLILYEPQYSIDDIKNVYMLVSTHNFIIVQTKNKIFTGIMSKNDIYFKECYATEDDIHNSYVVDNTLFVITNNGFYKTNLSNQLPILEKIKIDKEQLELITAQKESLENKDVAAIQNIITTLQEEKSIANLKELFNSTDHFLIKTLDTIPIMYQRGDGSITDIMQLGYLRPILRQWILKIAREQNYFKTNAKLDNIVGALENKINDLSTWIPGLQVTNVYTKISQDHMYRSDQDKKKFVERFKTLDLETVQAKDTNTYNEYLRSLSLCYAMETVIFNIDGKDQTYLEYTRKHFVKMADKIKNLKIDTLNVLHQANLIENK